MTTAPAIGLTYFPRLRDAQGQRVRCSWPALVERLQTARVVSDKHDAPGLSLATYEGDRRALARVEAVYAVGLDLDDGVDWDELLGRFGGGATFLHTTWSSTPECIRARVFLLLSRPVTADEYRRVYASIVSVCEDAGLVVDRAASDPSRLWFLPSIPPGGAYRYSVGVGGPVDVEAMLAKVPVPAPPAPTVPSAPSANGSGRGADLETRAAAYLARCEPAISGQGGHRVTFLIAQRLVRGFSLDEGTAFRLLCSWNATCQPPWSEWELRRKIRQAAEHGRHAVGDLRDADRRRA